MNNSLELANSYARLHGPASHLSGDFSDVEVKAPRICRRVSMFPRPTMRGGRCHRPRAGELRARQFRRDRRISLADCFVLAVGEPGTGS